MKCKRTIDWIRYTLEFKRQEMQAIITWLGWSISDTFSEMTDEDLTELYRLEHEIKGVWARVNPFPEHKDWFFRHVVHQERVHAPYRDRDRVNRGTACGSDPVTHIAGEYLVETLDMRLGE